MNGKQARRLTRDDAQYCPGSDAHVRADEIGWGVCPYCNQDKRVNPVSGTLRAHAKPK